MHRATSVLIIKKVGENIKTLIIYCNSSFRPIIFKNLDAKNVNVKV